MENSIAKMRPALVAEWSEKNMPITPDDVSYGSNKLYWWKGSCGHEWQTSAKARAKGEGCPICSGARIVTGINDFETLHPKLAKEWHYEKNAPLLPTQVTAFSNKKVWWKCNEGHEWYTHIATRSDGSKCPYCSGIELLKGYNDLQTRYPALCREWSGRNETLTPDMVNEKSLKNVWWKCQVCGHEYKAVIKSRVNGVMCPVCTEREIKAGCNDLATTHPKIAMQWELKKNRGKTPQTISAGSMRSVWWNCERGHSYKARICDRTKGGIGCYVCESEYRDALLQLLVLYYVGTNGMKTILCSEEVIGVYLEIYIPELRLAIELAATTSSGRKEQEVKKHICRMNGITYLLVKDEGEKNLAEEVRCVLRKKHIYIYSDIQEDLKILRGNFERWKNNR